MSGDSSLKIVRCYIEHASATGEGNRYECDDGQTWRDAQPFEEPTGDKHGDTIIPRLNR